MAIVESMGREPDGRFRDVQELDSILRGDLTKLSALQGGEIPVSPTRLSRIIIILSMVYGLCMGTFALFSHHGPSVQQLIATTIKVPLLFYLTLLVTLPSLYVFNALVGSRLSFSSMLRLLIATLGVNTAVLCSLGPIVAFFSASTTSYPFMVLFNVTVFAVSGFLAQMFLSQTLQRLNVAESIREAEAIDLHEPTPAAVRPLSKQFIGDQVRTIFRVWMILFGLVGAQMGWVLRPFIGNPNTPFSWFRERRSNFFEAVLTALSNLFS